MEPLLGSRLNVTTVTSPAGPQMTEKFASPQIFIRCHTASEICDVVVLVRGQEMVLRCPSYSQALKWARLECKSYKIPQPDIEPLNGLDHDELPFCALPKQLRPKGKLARAA
jgi:hypothetical protein